MNAVSFAQMKPGAFLINTARGPIVDAKALADALDQGHLAGAALDVYTLEGRVDAVLLERPNVVTTTHMGAYTQESLYRTTLGAVESILDLLEGKRPAGLINPEIWREHDKIFTSPNDLIVKSVRK
jgi:D-3-phosphoglycerate dehydrogenase